MAGSNGNGKNRDGAVLGFENKLWEAADKLRSNMDAAEYKHVVLGLIFLKYISDAFEEQYKKLVALQEQGADPEDRDEYLAENVFWVPKKALVFPKLAKSQDRMLVGQAWRRSRRSPSLRTFFKGLCRPALDKTPGRTLDQWRNYGRDYDARCGCWAVYEHSRGCEAEEKGGQFYTLVYRPDVGSICPYQGRIYDPCCGPADVRPGEKFVGRRRPPARYQCLRAGVEPDNLAAGEDEPCHTGD